MGKYVAKRFVISMVIAILVTVVLPLAPAYGDIDDNTMVITGYVHDEFER